MNYKEERLDAFTVVGIAVRTTNQDGKGLQDIGELFNRFFSEQIALAIPNKVCEDVYCVYTDYESDFQGEYTTILGCKVSEAESLPKGFGKKEIPECNYQQYEAQGEVHESVGRIWTHIWESDIDRAYIADFDVYGEEAKDPKNALVRTYLSID